MKKTVGKDGGILVMVMVIMLAFSMLAFGLFKLHETDAVETVYVKQSTEAFWLAEAGLQSAMTKLRRPGQAGKSYRALVTGTDENSATTIGPVAVSNGSYKVLLWTPDGSTSNFVMKSTGTVMGQDRLLHLNVTLGPLGPYGLTTLNGDSTIRDGANIVGSVYQNGELAVKGDVTITGDVLAGNHEDFSSGVPIPEDGYIDMHIDTDDFDPYLTRSVTTNAASITNSLDLLDGAVVVDSSIDPSLIISTGSTATNKGILVVKNDQTFSKDLVIGSNITIIVDGNLKISKEGIFGDNVTLFATGELDLFKEADVTATPITGTGCTFLSLLDAKVWKEFTFDGLFFTEGTFYADKDLNVSGTIITEEGFTLKRNATVTFDESVISADAYDNLVVTYMVVQSRWNELPFP